MQSFILWCGGDIKRLHEPLHFRDIPEKFCFLGGKRCFINNFKGKARDSAGQETPSFMKTVLCPA